MDEMKLKLSTKIMRGMLSKIFETIVSKKFGIKTKIELNEIEMEMIEDKIRVHINADSEISKSDLLTINRLIEKGS